MNQAVQKTSEVCVFDEIDNTQKTVSRLMKTPHYAKMGEAGIFTVVQMARSVGINILDALNGDLYYLPSGKVEMTSRTMNYLIRKAGHSITKDERSNHQICILRGKRADTGDSFCCSFSIEEAKKAGIYKTTWEKYPDDMLFARALTRLARQLFPDVIKGCYVEGEIQDISVNPKEIHETTVYMDAIRCVGMPIVEEPKKVTISQEEADLVSDVLSRCSIEYQEKVRGFLLETKGIKSYVDLTPSLYTSILNSANKHLAERSENGNDVERDRDVASDSE